MMIDILKLLRAHQWTKNVLLFAGLIFTNHIFDYVYVSRAFIGFVLFSSISSVIYIINDLLDREIDRQHPRKRHRPLAAGRIKPQTAVIIAAFLFFGAIIGASFLSWKFLLIMSVYFAVMTTYSLALKHIVILDLMIVALGFVMRAVAGIFAIELPGETIPITPWFLSCVLFLSLFIVICKRRHEIVLLSDDARHHRPVLEHYSGAFLDQMVNVATTATIMSYSLYVTLGIDESKPWREKMVLTLPFVVYGIFRYLYLVYKKEEGGAPEILLFQDKSLLVAIIGWFISVVLIMYL